MIPVEILISKGALVREIGVGDSIFKEGTTANFYYQIIKGRVRTCNFLDDGREVLHQVLGPHEGLGLASILDRETYIATAIADAKSTVYKISVQAFYEILTEYPYVGLGISKVLAKEIRFKVLLMNIISLRSPEAAVTKLIQLLHDEGRLICPECNKLLLTRQQLANMTGLRVETIIRTMKQMEREQKISIMNGKVFVKQLKLAHE